MKSLSDLESEYEDGDRDRVLSEIKCMADSGSSEAMLVYASLLDDREDSGKESLSDEIIQYFSLALDEKEYGAAFHLGSIYLEGVYVKQNKKRAMSYFRIGSEHGDSDCMEAFADLLSSGKNPKYRAAFDWYLVAINSGSDCRFKCMQTISAGKLTGSDVDKFKAEILKGAKKPLLIVLMLFVVILFLVFIW